WIHSTLSELALGESVSVDGCCLTVTGHRNGVFSADISPETLQRTKASAYRPGATVNLERALRVGDRMGGHWVTGHVDTTLTVTQSENKDGYRLLRLDGVHPSDRAFL